MEVGLIITVLIALIGWGIAIWQMYLNHKWQKRDALIQRKYEIYSRFMVKVDEAYNEFMKSPDIITGNIMSDFLTASMDGDKEEIHNAIANVNRGLIDFVWNSIKPMQTLNSEMSAVRLIASEELLLLVDELQELIMAALPKLEDGMSRLDINDAESFNMILQLREVKPFDKIEILKEKIESQMRKEIYSNQMVY